MADHEITRSEEGGLLAHVDRARRRHWSNSPAEHPSIPDDERALGQWDLDHGVYAAADSTPSIDADYPPAALVMADVKLTRTEWSMVLSGLETRAEVFDDLEGIGDLSRDYTNLARRIRAAVR